MALGAKVQQIQTMVVTQGARVVILGVAIGAVVAVAMTRALGGLLFGIEALDAVTFLGMSAAMLGVGFWRATCPPDPRPKWIRSKRCESNS